MVDFKATDSSMNMLLYIDIKEQCIHDSISDASVMYIKY